MVVILRVLSNIESIEILKAFKYRMYPNKTQKIFLEKQYYNDTTKELVLLKKQPEYIWLKNAA